MTKWNEPENNDPSPHDDDENIDERLTQIGLLISDLRFAAGVWQHNIEQTLRAAEAWLPALDGVPLDEIARRDPFSLQAELARRGKHGADDVVELWDARQGRGAQADFARTQAEKRESEFSEARAGGPGHRRLMDVGRLLGWNDVEVAR